LLLRTLAHAEKLLGVEFTLHDDSDDVLPEPLSTGSKGEPTNLFNLHPFADREKVLRKYQLTDEQWLRKRGYLQEEPDDNGVHNASTQGKAPIEGHINTWDLPDDVVDVTVKKQTPASCRDEARTFASPVLDTAPRINRLGSEGQGTKVSPSSARTSDIPAFTLTEHYEQQIPLEVRKALEKMYKTKEGNLDVPLDAEEENREKA